MLTNPPTNKQRKGNLERLLIDLKRIHGDNYSYTNVNEQHIQTIQSRIPLLCNRGNHPYNPTIHELLIQKAGCPCLNNTNH